MKNIKQFIYNPNLTVKAVQFTGLNESTINRFTNYKPNFPCPVTAFVLVPTRHGVVTAYKGDWVIEVKDEIGTFFEVFTDRYFTKFFTELKPSNDHF